MFRGKISWLTLFLFLAIVAISALFRLNNLDLIEFKSDEAINLFLASRPLFDHPFPPGGTVSSIGLLNFPLFHYLLFPFILTSLDPKMISFFIGLLNSLAIGFLFLLIRRYYDVITALIASLLFALSPWAIIFSRKIWAQNLILPFLMILLYSLHKIISEKKMVFWTSYAFSSLFLLQLHQSTFLFLFFLNLFLLIKKVKIDFRYLSFGLFFGFLPTIPYFVYISKNILSAPSAFLVAKERFSPTYFPIVFFRPFQIMGQGNFHFVLGDDMLAFASRFPLAYHLRRFLYLEYFILPLGMLIFWKKFSSFRPFIYTCLALPTAYFLLHLEPFVHYFLVLTPFLFLFLASFFAFALQSNSYLLKALSLALLFLFVISSFAFNTAFFRLLRQQRALKGDYGTAFVVKEEKAKELFQSYQNDEAYQEMLLVSYLPKNLFCGYLPLGKMIYPLEETRGRLSILEERLKQIPEDPRVQNELLSFYTNLPLTKKTVIFLEEKSASIPGYKPIYEEVHQLFLSQNP